MRRSDKGKKRIFGIWSAIWDMECDCDFDDSGKRVQQRDDCCGRGRGNSE